MSPAIDYGSPAFELGCDCGWTGRETDIDSWDVQTDADRVVRCCPGCSAPVPEWGTYRPIDGLRRVARGPLREALDAAGREDA